MSTVSRVDCFFPQISPAYDITWHSVCRSVSVSIPLSVWLSVSVCVFLCLSVCLCMSMSIHTSITHLRSREITWWCLDIARYRQILSGIVSLFWLIVLCIGYNLWPKHNKHTTGTYWAQNFYLKPCPQRVPGNVKSIRISQVGVCRNLVAPLRKLYRHPCQKICSRNQKQNYQIGQKLLTVADSENVNFCAVGV